MIRAVSFDVGGTLMDPHPSVGHVYARAGKPYGLAVAPGSLDRAFRAAWARRESEGRVRVTSRAWWRRIVDEVFDRVGFDGDRAGCFEACYGAFARPDAWRVHDDARPAMRSLSAAGYRLGVLSNWDDRLPRLLDGLGLAAYLEWSVVSALESVQKPDPRIFARVCEVSGLEAASILHVGDHPLEDVAAARRAGMAALHLDRTAPAPGGDVITDLREIAGRLAAMAGRPGGA